MLRFVYLTVACALVIATGSVGAAADDGLLIKKQSAHSVDVTLDRLAKTLEAKGIKVFARVDHAANAKNAGLELAPTQLLIFGNPKMGTPLMLADRRIGIDLPMKALAWSDDDGKVWLGIVDPQALKARFKIAGRDKIFEKMNKALGAFTDAAVAK